MKTEWLTTVVRAGAIASALVGCSSPEPSYPKAPTSEPAVVLRYAVESRDGEWIYEIVRSGDLYAERRTRVDGSSYAFGVQQGSAWLRVGDRPAVHADDVWRQEARTRQGLMTSGFRNPHAGDVLELIERRSRATEVAYRPAGGQTLHLMMDRSTGSAVGFDVVDTQGGIWDCGRASFGQVQGFDVLTKADCAGIIHEVGSSRSHVRLVGAEPLKADEQERWWAPTQVITRTPMRSAAEFDVAEGQTPVVPVQVGESEPYPFLVDSGAFATIVSEEAAEAMGVVPTGETPQFVRPTWLRQTLLWVGVADRFRVGPAEVFGMRVLVAERDPGLHGMGGLIGADFFDHFVVDVDSPERRLRVMERDQYRPGPQAVRLAMQGNPHRGMMVAGSVTDVAEGAVTLDTGAELDVVVNALEMTWKHPRRKGSDANLSTTEASRSPDYETEIDGLMLGPFGFPAMAAYGRDHFRDRVGPCVALVGMGLMRYMRVTFDARAGSVFVTPGPAYLMLVRGGIEVDDRSGMATVTRVLPGGPGKWAKVRENDVVLDVNGAPVTSAQQARRLIGSSPQSAVSLRLGRGEIARVVQLPLADR